MQLTTQVAARNTRSQVVVLSSDAKGSEYVEWQAKDDPNGADMQIVPDTIAQSVPFIRLVQRGIIVIENADENPELDDAVRRQREAFERRTSTAKEKAQDSIEQTQDNDMVTLPCIGPDTRGQGRCGADVMVRERTKNDKPPLCNVHDGLAAQYVPSEEQVGTSNVRQWTRVTMGQPERQNA